MDAKLTSQFDQTFQYVKDELPQFLKWYHMAMIAHGFSQLDALYLTGEISKSWLAGVMTSIYFPKNNE